MKPWRIRQAAMRASLSRPRLPDSRARSVSCGQRHRAMARSAASCASVRRRFCARAGAPPTKPQTLPQGATSRVGASPRTSVQRSRSQPIADAVG